MLHTLALITLVLIVAFALAMSTLSQLNLSARYAQRTQADCVARAAMTEFIIRARQADPNKDVTSLGKSVLDVFRTQPTLLQPRGQVDGSARLLLDHCVDNSSNSQAASSHFDATGVHSVPPFSLSLVYLVHVGTHNYVYESLVQQRWPYALASPGPIVIPGRVGPDPAGSTSNVPTDFWSAPSEIVGRVLSLQTDIGAESDSPLPGETRSGALRTPITVSTKIYEALYPYAKEGGLVPYATGRPPQLQDNQDRLRLGGPLTLTQISLTKPPPSGSTPVPGFFSIQRYEQDTRGATIHRGVDLAENLPSGSFGTHTQPVVKVASGNTIRGRIRYDYRIAGMNSKDTASRKEMQALFSKPDTSSWSQVHLPNGGAGEIVIARARIPAGTPGISDTATQYSVPTGQCRYHGNFRPAGPDLDSTVIDFYLSSLGIYTTGSSTVSGSLILQDVALGVEGDMSLENYVLKGSNATLVVDGTLTIDGGYLDAGDNGLVIFCRRLIMKAQGNFNGLIVAEKGAALFGSGATEAPDHPGLLIRGGMLVGGSDLLIAPSPAADPTSNLLMPLSIRGLTLTSTRIEYEPRYLRGLNRFGNYEVLATDLRQ